MFRFLSQQINVIVQGLLLLGQLCLTIVNLDAEKMSESEAINLLNEAEAKLKSKGWFGLGGAKYDEAAELFAKAANAYKLVKMCIVLL